MANIKPFKGYFYNSEKVGDVQSVIAPTKYNISEDERRQLYELNDYNAVRIFDGQETDDDTQSSNKYTRASEYLNDWIENDVLVRDDKEAIYLYEETVWLHGNRFQNLTFVALLEIEELGGDIRTCEDIREGSKKDRYDLLKATNADMSMISCLYTDHNKELLSIMNTISRNDPDIEIGRADDVHRRVWRITDEDTISRITGIFKGLKLYITDGQTRYTTCLKYRDFMRDNNPNHRGDEAYNYTMVSFFDSNSDGFAVMPEHRKIKLPKGFSEEYFVAAAQEHFKVEKIIVDAQDERITTTMKKQIQTKQLSTRVAVYHGKNYFYRLTLNDTDYIKKQLKPEKSEYYCGLDPVVVRELIIRDILGVDDNYDDLVSTSVSSNECAAAIAEGSADVMIVLNPVKVEEIEGVTGEGETLPLKSISIFPKPSVGVIINLKDDKK